MQSSRLMAQYLLTAVICFAVGVLAFRKRDNDAAKALAGLGLERRSRHGQVVVVLDRSLSMPSDAPALMAVDGAIQGTIRVMGVMLLSAAVAAWFVRPEGRLNRLARVLVGLGGVIMAVLILLQFRRAYFQVGMLIEHGIQCGVPWLLLAALKPGRDFKQLLIPIKVLIALTFVVLGGAFMGALGLFAGIFANKFDQMAAITNFIVTPLAFLSGTFYSVEALPPLLNRLTHLNPVFYLIDGLRYGMIGVSDSSPWLGMAVCTFATLVIGAITWLMLRTGYRLKA